MTSGGWQSQEQRHGRHRRGSTGTAWTPAVRPTDNGPAHAQHDGAPAFRPTETAPVWPGHDPAAPTGRPCWPTEDTGADVLNRQDHSGRHGVLELDGDTRTRRQRWSAEASDSDVLTRRAGWPLEPADVPAARVATSARHAWPSDTQAPAPFRLATSEPAHTRPRHAAEPEVPQQQRRKTVSSDMVLDTVPMGRVKHRRADTGPLSSAIVYALPDTPPSGLRKFDLGTVPASVTPPRTWRKAAWFAVGTSAAVVLGLTVASAELMGKPVEQPMIDALPAYPSGPLTLEKLPNQQTTTDSPDTTNTNHTPPTSKPGTAEHSAPHPDTVIGGTTDGQTSEPGGDTGTGTGSGSTTLPTTPAEPTRVTVGRQPVTPTDPQQMGDTTEEYFRLVTTDPAAAHAMTTGGMAREGAEGIEARYTGVERVEVQAITIDRNEAITTSTVKVVHEDGTETVEERQLTFTWGGDPKITDDSTTG